MSILIRGMRFPKTCDECLINCERSMLYIGITDRRSPNCPLVKIPTPHGRLIDADELKSKFRHGKGNNDADSAWISTIRRFITQAETAIEAEGETDGR